MATRAQIVNYIEKLAATDAQVRASQFAAMQGVQALPPYPRAGSAATRRAASTARDRAYKPINAFVNGNGTSPITNQKEGYLHNASTSVYVGDAPSPGQYKEQVFDERSGASAKDAGAFARANAGMTPRSSYTPPTDSYIKPYPGAPFSSAEAKAAPAGSMSSFGTKAPWK